MGEPDWRSGELDHGYRVYMVDPLDHSSVLGELEAYADAGSVTWSRGDGTLVGAALEIPDWSQRIDGSWLRIVHVIPSCGYSRTLGTFIVWSDGVSGGVDGVYGASPELASALRGIERDLLPDLLVIGRGASLKEALARLLGPSPVPYRFSGGFKDYRFSEPHVYDIGESRLDVARSLAAIAGDEVGVGEDGSVDVSPRTDPADVTPLYALDADEERSLVIEGSVAPISDASPVPGRSIAVWNGGGNGYGQESISAYVDVSVRHPASPQRRGYVISALHELEDMPDSKTQAGVQRQAARWLSEDSVRTRGWTCKTVWLPIVAGDVVSFRPPGGEFAKCVVDSVSASLSEWLLDLTLKEV